MITPPSTHQPIASLDRDALFRLVSTFYGHVRRDTLLFPIFARRIADDAWPQHLERMTDFWSSVLLASKSYVGNPMAKHAALTDDVPDLGARHFDHWLDLFESTVRDLFVPKLADEITLRARNMGAGLLRAVERQATQSPGLLNRIA